MEPLETLKNEHGLIRQYLDHLEAALKKMREGARPPRPFFDKAVHFARDFADDYHHLKEEYVLFVRLAQKHAGEYDGQIESLRHQHETGRDHVATIAGALDGYEEGTSVNTDTIMMALMDYIPMLRDHIHTEDHVFFPMAGEQLTDEEEDQLRKEFDQARERAGDQGFEYFHKMVVDMGSILTHM